MRKLLSILYVFLIVFNTIFSDDDFTSKSFFSLEPIYRPTSPEDISLRRDLLIFTDEEKKYSIDISIFGGSTVNERDLAKYFLPFGKTEIIAGELGSPAVKQGTVDVIANYFGVLTDSLYKINVPVDNTLNNYTFQSKFSFAPKQKFFGVTLNYKQHLSRYNDKGFWFEIVIPIEHVQNDIGFKEKIIQEGGPNGDDPNVPKGFVGSMKEAFNQRSWRFGKINGTKDKTAIADLYIKAGYLSIKEETHHLNSFLGISLPTGNQVTGEFIFEPIVGQNNHTSFFAGISAGFRIWSDCEKSLYYEFDSCGTVFFSNIQMRSFDLKDKSWSRYMWVYLDSKDTTTSPGINTFTKHLTVQPGTARDLNSALVFKDKGFQGEVGYHFYSRGAEEIKFSKPWIAGPAIATIIKSNEFIAGGTSRNNATIKQYLGIANDQVNSKQVYKEIQESDIDLESASHPAIISHTVYLALSYHWLNAEYPKFIGLGGSYEFASNNAITQRWMLWTKFGINF